MKSRGSLLLLAWFAACASPSPMPTAPRPPALRSLAAGQAEPLLGCPQALSGRPLGSVASDKLTEISGLVASSSQPGVFWTHNDSGDRPRAFAIDGHGKQLAQLSISGAWAEDWEDIALLRGSGGRDQLVLADIGDNWSGRDSVQLYLVPEPTLTVGNEQALSARARRLEVRYEDGARDAEALLADPLTGDLYIVEKAMFLRTTARVGVYRIAAQDVSGTQTVARRVAEVPLGPVTAGDVRPDGLAVVLRNYGTGRYYERKRDQPLFEAFAGEGCALELADTDEQGEALCFAHDGASYFTVAEGSHPNVYQYELKAR